MSNLIDMIIWYVYLCLKYENIAITKKTGVFVESKTFQFNKGGLRCPENLSSVYVGKVDSTAAKIAQLV